MNRRFYSWMIVLLTCVIQVPAQIIQPSRFEIPMEPRDYDFIVTSAEENGMVLFRPMPTYESGDQLWQFMKLDSSLQVNWSMDYYIDNRLNLVSYSSNRETLILAMSRDPDRNRDLLFLKFHLADSSLTTHEFENLFAIEITDMVIVENAVVVSGIVNYRPTVICYDLTEGSARVAAGSYNNDTEVIQLSVDKQYPVFEVLTSEKNELKQLTIASSIYDAAGELIDRTELNPGPENNLIFGRSTFGEFRYRLFVGTYSKNKSDYSRGIFVARVDDYGDQKINYYNYSELENFFNYMRAGRKKRIKKRIERKRISGKNVKFNYRLMVHDIFERADGSYVMLGEAFYPFYGNSSNPVTYDNNWYRQNSIRDIYSLQEFKYTHAVIIGFNKTGEIIWDNSFEINDVTTLQLEQYVHAVANKDEIVLLYVYDEQIRSKIIQEDEIIEGKVFNDIQLKFEDDLLVDETSERVKLRDWYGNYFYMHGRQKIKNLRESDSGGNRWVFFINKISYR